MRWKERKNRRMGKRKRGGKARRRERSGRKRVKDKGEGLRQGGGRRD